MPVNKVFLKRFFYWILVSKQGLAWKCNTTLLRVMIVVMATRFASWRVASCCGDAEVA
jgi:hypothetical protein